ncbi:hypothetical protein PIB30_067859 [Stylosanthes scabra]|uniref:Uncharacterized protein n=1 Tax=Stylosanthes scabra TaxID=79078 RepID=A0ABU6UQ74_9FABA|nr:hypothetical protein [Stylosanthes scabra]
MSFPNQAFWMAKDTGSLNDGDMTCDDSSRLESKRAHQWFMDAPEAELFPNKKQAVAPPNNLLSGMLNSNLSSWGNSSSFQPLTDDFTEQLFDPDTATTNHGDANISSVSMDNKLGGERKDSMNPYGSAPSFGLSMSCTLDDPCLVFNYDGIRKVKVNEVKESHNGMSVPENNPYDNGVSSTVLNPQAYKGDDSSMSMNLAYTKGDANIISMDDPYCRTDNSLMSVVQSHNKGEDGLSIHQTYKDICNTISMDQGFSKVDSSMASIAQAYKADDNSMLRDYFFDKVENGTVSAGQPYGLGGNNMPFVSPSYNSGESTIISFGGCDDDDPTHSGLFVSSYDMLMGQALKQKSEAVNEKEFARSNSNLLLNTAHTSASETESVSKTKEEIKMSKKATSNNFPSNVRSLLSTGMLDGVSVKYKAWSREVKFSIHEFIFNSSLSVITCLVLPLLVRRSFEEL